MDILYVLLVLLVLTRIGGEIAERLKQPALVGELLAGVALGVVVGNFAGAFPVLADLSEDKVFTAITDLGIFFLMLLAGIKLRPKQLVESSASSMLVALAGFLLPLGLGFGLGWAYLPDSEFRIAQALFLGTALAITAVPVTVKVLMDVGRLESKAGRMIVSAAVVDDVLSLVLLAFLTALIKSGQLPDLPALGLLIGKILLFFAVTYVVGRFLFPRVGRLLKRAKVAELELSVLLIVALGFAVLAEVLSMHFIIGAFVAGLAFGRKTADPETYEDVSNKISGVTSGFLAPVFFASIGLHVSFSAIANTPFFVLLLVLIAIAGKLLGAGVTAYGAGLGKRESFAVGMGMSARGAVELIVADVALRAGLFSVPSPVPAVIANMFSAVVLMAVVTTLLAPIGIRWALRAPDKDG